MRRSGGCWCDECSKLLRSHLERFIALAGDGSRRSAFIMVSLLGLLLIVVVAGALPTTPQPPRFKLVIGNKAYSSWSLRAWLALHRAVGDQGFEECCVELAGAGSDANKAALMKHSPTGKVPALDDRLLDVTVWDSLAIAEHVAECYPAAKLWPSDARARAVARSVVAEMHSGFSALRSAMPMNVRRERSSSSSSSRDLARRRWRRQAQCQRVVAFFSASTSSRCTSRRRRACAPSTASPTARWVKCSALHQRSGAPDEVEVG